MESFIEQFERETARFIEADNNAVPVPSDDSFMIHPGDSTVMVSAPHSVSQWRNDHEKCAESSTGALALLANEWLGCPTIFKTANAHDDANYDVKSPYREALAAFIANHGIELLLDLHQLSPERPMDICVGTGHGRNIAGQPQLVKAVCDAFYVCGLEEVTLDDPFAAGGPHTISYSMAARCGIPCFQIEINSRLLMDCFDDYRPDAVFEALAHIVSLFDDGGAADDWLAGR